MIKKIFSAAEVLFFFAMMLAACIVLVIVFPKGSDAPAWVQAIGSVLAIGVAIAIPTAQRRRDRIEAKRKELEAELVMWSAAASLVWGVLNWLGNMQSYSDAFRSHARQDRTVDDLLDRIKLLETRDQNSIRAMALNRARDAIIVTHADLVRPSRQSTPMRQEEIDQMRHEEAALSGIRDIIYRNFEAAQERSDAHRNAYPPKES